MKILMDKMFNNTFSIGKIIYFPIFDGNIESYKEQHGRPEIYKISVITKASKPFKIKRSIGYYKFKNIKYEDLH